MSLLLIEIIGWAGMITILTAYFLVSSKKLSPDSGTFQLLNLIGAAFVIVNVVYHQAYPSVALNTIWLLIALISLIKIYLKK